MKIGVACLALAFLSGCGAAVTQMPAISATSQAVTAQGSAAASAADFRASRPGLRRIGYRNCDGYAIELFAPARLSAARANQQSLFLNAYAYRGGGAVRLTLPGAATRLQRQTAGGWQDLPLAAATGGGSVGGPLAAVTLAQQLGQSAPLQPGRYRAWLGQFSASRAGGATCAIAPLWQFDLS